MIFNHVNQKEEEQEVFYCALSSVLCDITSCPDISFK